jgi:hypothetical protein
MRETPYAYRADTTIYALGLTEDCHPVNAEFTRPSW